jgi:hypothetical protein
VLTLLQSKPAAASVEQKPVPLEAVTHEGKASKGGLDEKVEAAMGEKLSQEHDVAKARRNEASSKRIQAEFVAETQRKLQANASKRKSLCTTLYGAARVRSQARIRHTSHPKWFTGALCFLTKRGTEQS